jgi:hypothetical protein
MQIAAETTAVAKGEKACVVEAEKQEKYKKVKVVIENIISNVGAK